MKHSEQALQWLSEGKTVLLAGKELTSYYQGSENFTSQGFFMDRCVLDTIVDAGLPLTYKEPEPKVKIHSMGASMLEPGWTRVNIYIKGNVTEAQVKAALESIGEKQ